MIDKYIKGIIAVCLAAILWGFDGVYLTPNLYNLPVPLVVSILHFIPFIIMSIILAKKFSVIPQFSTKDIIIFLMISLFGGVIGTISIVKALFLLEFDHLSIVVLLQKLQPVFAILLAYIFLKEALTKRILFYTIITLIASYTLTFELSLPNLHNDKNYIEAIIYSVVAAFSFGSATVYGKLALKKYDFVTTTFYRFGFTSIIMLIYLIFFCDLHVFTQISKSNWITFIIISFTTGSGAIFLYYYGLKKIKAMVAAICELCFPVSTILFDYLLNDNILSFIQWISVIVICVSIIKINGTKKV